MIEVESKFALSDADEFRARLIDRGGQAVGVEHHVDHYFNHPAKDFAVTGEALRVRIVDGVARVTYKGPRLAGKVKARPEHEWRLGGEDPRGDQLRRLLETLDFRPVAVVEKSRHTFRLDDDATVYVIAIDDAGELGMFAEIERVVDSPGDVAAVQASITSMARSLGLDRIEPRSYLTMTLESK